jgi:hypothetical protein
VTHKQQANIFEIDLSDVSAVTMADEQYRESSAVGKEVKGIILLQQNDNYTNHLLAH